jgi:hypothetical protein
VGIAEGAVRDETKISERPSRWKALFSGGPVSEKQMLQCGGWGATLEGRDFAISGLRLAPAAGSTARNTPREAFTMSLTLRQLKYFSAVAEAGRISHAALQLNISNALDKTYRSGSFWWGAPYTYGEPRKVLLTTTYEF